MMRTEPRSGTVRGSVPGLRLPIPVSGYSRPGGSVVTMKELVNCRIQRNRARIGTNSVHRSTGTFMPIKAHGPSEIIRIQGEEGVARPISGNHGTWSSLIDMSYTW